MKTQFNGERLKKARIYRGLTVAELAEQVGCQRQTLSMYEISKSQPTDKELVDRLSRALSFPVKFFYEHPVSNTEGTVYFRSLLTTNKKYRSEQIVKMDFLARYIRYCRIIFLSPCMNHLISPKMLPLKKLLMH